MMRGVVAAAIRVAIRQDVPVTATAGRASLQDVLTRANTLRRVGQTPLVEQLEVPLAGSSIAA